MKKASLVIAPERIDDPVKWLRSNLLQLATFEPVEIENSSERGQQLNYIEHTLLPAMRIVDVFLDEIDLPEKATQPITHIVAALKLAAEERPQDLFRITARKSRASDSKEIWFERLRIARLGAVLEKVEPGTNALRRIYDELETEIIAIKGKGNPRSSSRPPAERVIKGWIDFLQDERQRPAKHVPEWTLALRSFYQLTLEAAGKHYEGLNTAQRAEWLREQLAAIREDLNWQLEDGRHVPQKT